MSFVLPPTNLEAVGLRPQPIERLCAIIEGHIAERRYPGAQIAIARHGQLAFFKTFGAARFEPEPIPARDDTLWLLYSNTKVITAAAIWILVEEGALTFQDRVADHVPEFARFGKGDITVLQLLTHQGGFPKGPIVPPPCWEDHDALRCHVCDFTLEWTPGSRVEYHSSAAHWVAAVLIEAVAKTDFRAFIRTRIIEPLGLEHDLFVGMPEREFPRAAEMYEPSPDGTQQLKLTTESTPDFRRAGIPGGGGYATARAMVAFYQMMVHGGRLGSARIVSPRMIEYVTQNFTEDRVDLNMGMPMHRGLGPHSRGYTDSIRGLGSIASPTPFGHGGVGSSYSWGDPESGVSFSYLSNSRIPDPWHSRRLDIVSNCVHAAIEDVV